MSTTVDRVNPVVTYTAPKAATPATSAPTTTSATPTYTTDKVAISTGATAFEDLPEEEAVPMTAQAGGTKSKTLSGTDVDILSNGAPGTDPAALPPLGVTHQPDGSRSSHWANHSDYQTPQEADQAYQEMRDKLAQPSQWTNVGGATEFTHFRGNPPQPATGEAKVGDVLAMTIGDGQVYYVKVDDIQESADGYAITVRPTHDPFASPPNPAEIDHFFDDRATNTFSVSKNGTRVDARAVALGEHVNHSKNTVWDGYNEVVAHTAWGQVGDVGLTGTAAQGQAQWNHFLERLVDTQNPRPTNAHTTYAKPNPFTQPSAFVGAIGREVTQWSQKVAEPVVNGWNWLAGQFR